MSEIHIYTIGFTKKKAEYFFEQLKKMGIKRIIDVRLNNVSQLAGFAKKNDLKYFLKEICHIDYIHVPEFAPTKDILDVYKKHNSDWNFYQEQFLQLIEERHIENRLSKDTLNNGCLLCSEDKPEHCHRRLVAEYLQDKWKDVRIDHII